MCTDTSTNLPQDVYHILKLHLFPQNSYQAYQASSCAFKVNVVKKNMMMILLNLHFTYWSSSCYLQRSKIYI